MVKASDLPPDERLAHQAQMQATLDRVAASNDRLAAREAERWASGVELVERHQERMRQREDRQRAEADAAQWDRRKMIERRLLAEVDRRIATATAAIHKRRDAFLKKLVVELCAGLGDEVSKDTAAERELTRRELAAGLKALDDRIADLERAEAKRVEQEAEAKRVELAKPRLVGFVGHAS
jgi:hypothetical protein